MRSRAAAALLALGGLFLIVGIAGQRWELVSLLLPFTSIVLLYALLWRPADLVMSATWDIKTERAFAGDTIESVLTLRYQGKGGRIGVVDVTLPHSVEVVEGDAKFPLLLGPHGELQVTYKLRFPRRGVYTLGPIKGTTMDLAGMTSTVCEARSAAEVRVSPRVFEIDRHPPKTSKLHTAAGNINSKLLGPGIDFFNLRCYVPGDSHE